MKTFAIAAMIGLLFQAERRPQQGQGAEVGQAAPAFKLKTQDGKAEVELAKLRGKPVMLIFGSWT